MKEKSSLNVAAVQMVSGASVEANLAKANQLVTAAVEKGAQLVLLPEYFCFMGRRDADKLAIAETPGAGPIQEFLARTAQRHRIWLIGGTLPLRSEDENRIYNASLVFDPDGKQEIGRASWRERLEF